MPGWQRERYAAPSNWKHLKAKVLRLHETRCHICGHPGAEQVDHIISVAEWKARGLPGSPHQMDNLAPAHDEPCTTCGERCHVIKTQAEAAAGRARKARQRPTERHPGLLT